MSSVIICNISRVRYLSYNWQNTQWPINYTNKYVQLQQQAKNNKYAKSLEIWIRLHNMSTEHHKTSGSKSRTVMLLVENDWMNTFSKSQSTKIEKKLISYGENKLTITIHSTNKYIESIILSVFVQMAYFSGIATDYGGSPTDNFEECWSTFYRQPCNYISTRSCSKQTRNVKAFQICTVCNTLQQKKQVCSLYIL